ncbi:protein-glucosylgalactosylhydroxylysine glucosidase isoform X2 [Astatotilapia calliptera]|uniref:Glycoside hydrolase family 65 central catalytic domain-containing protein n=1 Tax=Astatotilapia calliptera TaxID=8154 RepID=A0A3P8PN53_ASTCA|nr:protein-glucosylgalactosylhydroxylysine glucosidase isoform X2 [Astatotilapia calliptera]
MSCDSDPYIFTTDTLPSNLRFLPPLANGHLGWRVYNNIMHMGGVYNGEGGRCHRADVPCPLAVKVELEEPVQHTYSLDTHKGIFIHTLSSASATATQSLYSHRHYPNLMVMEILLERQATSQEPVTVKLVSSFTPQSKDIRFETGPDYRGGSHIQGQTTTAEYPGGSCPTVHLIWTPVPVTLMLPPEHSEARWGFILVAASSLDLAEASFDEGLNLMATGSLRPSHEKAWQELWLQSKVEVTGSESLCKALIGCMFYLLSAFPSIHDTSSSFGGVSPGGLSNGGEGQDYWGHVFWDQDIWMYPGIALFYPKLARAVLEYRVGTIDGAKDNAQKQGYKGLKFPWESAVSGREVCPEDIYGQQEIHINGDVTLAFQHYLYLTEVSCHPMNITTMSMTLCTQTQWPSLVFSLLLNWLNSFSTLRPRNGKQWPNTLRYLLTKSISTTLRHPVKQADTVMLGYPLGLPMSPEVRRNDLEAYEPVTDPHGPAMTWGMFAIGWLELGEAEKAQLLLEKCFNNIQGPFQVWSESSDGSGAVNFLTGMGGFLQAVLFGYTGFRVQKDCLAFSSLLPNDVCELCVRGVNYLGSQMDWLLRKEEVCIILREQEGSPGNTKPCNLQVVLKASGTKIPLTPGQPVTFPREPGYVCKLISAASCWPF